MDSRFLQLFVVVFAFLVFNSCFAQLTFTPNWGKRSALNQLDFGNVAAAATNTNGANGINGNADSMIHFASRSSNIVNSGNNCKPSVDSLMLIYHMIQTEAERLDDCLQK